MPCPRTGVPLKAVNVGGITVDISETCGGVFFDHLELLYFDEKSERRGSVLADHLKQFQPPQLNLTQRIHCQKCVDIVMLRHYYSPNYNPKKVIEVDECLGCGGFWFDYGELEKSGSFSLQKPIETMQRKHSNKASFTAQSTEVTSNI
ncbi:TFIIB-type zinc ribbon-containing protein [Shewanella surugensis]|uniref:Zf-TFIIB domain-containing protein n=1 Tax=Shewanella surugensis TaxID=212020 RepID=A0ABT0LCL9_9GAMM|nr:zf-TFIIB domain-containing protein [Shewanella surugensis]MCL1125437.1 zf-TFIIB domain-containing protein [Shewanella surugensis]